jgi:hypothetical protein
MSVSTAEIRPHVRSLELMKSRAESVAADAKHLADSLRAEYARLLLAEAFPGYTLAVFARSWGEDSPRLLQVLSDRRDQIDIDLSESNPAALPQAQQTAVYAAQLQITLIGSDDEILEHLDPGETDHEGWEEFVLYLDPDREGAVSA